MVEPPDMPLIAVDGWEGPLDLLLALARRQKVDLRRLSVLDLVEQYLAVVGDPREQPLERAAEWLVMAAWLAFLKSALLLPVPPEAEPDAEELAERLRHRLRRLDAMRDAAAALFARPRLGHDLFARGAPEGLAVVARPAWQASLHDLLAAYGAVRARTRPVVHQVAARPVVTLEEALDLLADALARRPGWTALDRLVDPVAPSLRRSGLASAFAAALELARVGRAELQQDAPMAPLMLRAA
jgi:segregation and condensation protein A